MKKQVSKETKMINALTNKNYTDEDLLIFSVYIADNDITNNFVKISYKGLKKLEKKILDNRKVYVNYNDETTEIMAFNTHIEKDISMKTIDCEDYAALYADCFIEKNEKNKLIVFDITHNYVTDVHPSFSTIMPRCSICGGYLYDDCDHVEGYAYDDKLAYGIADDISSYHGIEIVLTHRQGYDLETGKNKPYWKQTRHKDRGESFDEYKLYGWAKDENGKMKAFNILSMMCFNNETSPLSLTIICDLLGLSFSEKYNSIEEGKEEVLELVYSKLEEHLNEIVSKATFYKTLLDNK